MTRTTDRRVRKLEKDLGVSDEPFELLPGLWITKAELAEVMRAVSGKTCGIPSKQKRNDGS